ncbi:MAG TPA: hypothetical protein VGN76_00980 [Gemmatimonadales bacterium]|jgi:hypothetical protein|nr:hypothetical protein [Gemmatimonadales bacterium]
MLSAAEVRPTQRRRRSPYSDKQHYQEYILQRIEGYKNSIGRDELLRLGDEAASELQATSEGQFVLTEVLMLESVDRLIMKRLSLRPYRRWRQQFLRLRAAQRTPTHWGLEPHCPLSALLPRIEPEDTALVVGTGAAPTTYLLAAHDAAVTFIAGDLGCVERVESRMAAEALSSLFESYVTHFEGTLPDFLSFLEGFDIVVIDPSMLLNLRAADRSALVHDLQGRSRPGGVHVILPSCSALAPEKLRQMYQGWGKEEELKRRRRPDKRQVEGLILSKPMCPPDTP